MTYLVRNDSENSDYSTKTMTTEFRMRIQPISKVTYSIENCLRIWYTFPMFIWRGRYTEKLKIGTPYAVDPTLVSQWLSNFPVRFQSLSQRSIIWRNIMSEQKTHDLHVFMRRLTEKMADNYRQIQERATEDPGTAGDQGEENWAELLRGWLPRTYEVVTKGKIINPDGDVSPQIDVLVLKSIYPKQLIDERQKMFLAAGVAAAFECKTTLKAEHIEKTMKNCVAIKRLYPDRKGSPYKELYAPIVYGLLAHSHSWKRENSTPKENIKKKLWESDNKYISHPRECLDLLCVADFATWTMLKSTSSFPKFDGPDVGAQTIYFGHTHHKSSNLKRFYPIGTLISRLTLRLAWEDPSLRDLADYYHEASIAGGAQGFSRKWHTSVYKNESRPPSRIGEFPRHPPWDEWANNFV